MIMMGFHHSAARNAVLTATVNGQGILAQLDLDSVGLQERAEVAPEMVQAWEEVEEEANYLSD